MGPNATVIVRTALAGSGIELVASCDIATYDARAPGPFQSAKWMPGARGLVVVGSAGPSLWRQFRAQMDEDPRRWREPDPLDRFVGRVLARGDAALAAAHVAFRRFEPTFHAMPRLDFIAMARLVGLGSDGPFGLLIHGEHGAWWALRGAWLVDADVDAPQGHRPPCRGCPAPCIGGRANTNGAAAEPGDSGSDGHRVIARATPETRKRCVVGQGYRYDDDQIAYHYDRLATVARLGGR